MILGHENEQIVKTAVEYQSELTDGVVQYNYQTGELVGASFTTGTVENPKNPFIEVFRLPQGERGEIIFDCDECPFKEGTEEHKNCCIDAYVDEFDEEFDANFRDDVERQIREIIEDHIGETLDKVNEIRIGISDIMTPYKSTDIRSDDFEMRVIDDLVDNAIENGFTEVTPLKLLEGDILHIISTDYNPNCEKIEGEDKVNQAIVLLGDGKLDEALECLK